MAVLNQNKDDEKESSQQQASGAPSLSSGSGQAFSAAPQQAKGTSSGRFTNIQNYLNANKQAGQNLAQNIGNQISQKGQQVRQDLGQAQQQFNEQANQGRLDSTKVMPEVQNILGRAGQAGFESDVDRFKRISGGQYTGPQGLQNADTLQAQGQAVSSLGKNLGTSAGRTQVLGQLYGGQGYTGGQRRLDDLLLSGNTNALAQARGMAGGVGTAVANAQNKAQGLAGYFGQEAAQVGSQAEQARAAAQQAQDTALSQKEQTAFTNEQQNVANLQKQLDQISKGTLTQDMVKQLGIGNLVGQGFTPTANLQAGMNSAADAAVANARNLANNQILTFGMDPAKIAHINDASGQITKANIASAEEAARLNALSKLGGMGNILDPSQAGTFKGSALALNDDYTQKRAAAEQQIQDLMREGGAAGLGGTLYYGGGGSDRDVSRYNEVMNAINSLLSGRLTVT